MLKTYKSKIFIILSLIAAVQTRPLLSLETGYSQRFQMASTDTSITDIVIPMPANFNKICDLSENGIIDIEYIPYGETFDAWNEIITLMHTFRLAPNEKELIEDIQKPFFKKGARIENISNIQEEHGLKSNTFIIDTPSMLMTPGTTMESLDKRWSQTIKNKNELIATKIIISPFSTVAIQYSIRYDLTSTSPEQKKTLKEKQLSFLKSCYLALRDKKKSLHQEKHGSTPRKQDH